MGGFERGISGIIESNDRSVNCGTTTALLKQTFFIWLTQFLLILLQFAIKNQFQVIISKKRTYCAWDSNPEPQYVMAYHCAVEKLHILSGHPNLSPIDLNENLFYLRFRILFRRNFGLVFILLFVVAIFIAGFRNGREAAKIILSWTTFFSVFVKLGNYRPLFSLFWSFQWSF